jgi:signal transduction histidine kinase
VTHQSAQAGRPVRPASSPPSTLRGRPLLAARIAWITATVLIIILYVAAVPVAYARYQTVCGAGSVCDLYWWYLAPKDVIALRELGLSVGFYTAYTLAVEVVYTLGFWAVGALIFWRKSDNWVALFVSIMLVTFGATNLIDLASETNSSGWLGTVVLFFGYISFFVAFYLFPDGRFVPHWTRWLVIVWVWFIGSSFVLSENSPLSPLALPSVFVVTLAVGLLGTMVLAQIYRYLRVSGPIERQQTKWVVFGLTTAIAGFILINLPARIFPEKLLQPGVSNVLYALVGLTVTNISLFLIPLSIGFAILNYRLWDIDIIVNRTLVYGTLTASVVGLYVLVVGGFGTLFHTKDDLAGSLVAAGVVAVLFAPLRDRLQRGVNRLMYGERDDPYAVLSRLGRRLETTLAPEAALESVAEAVSQALKVPYIAIELGQDGDLRRVSEHGAPIGETVDLPLVHQREEIGRMLVSPRAPGEKFSPEDTRLLEDLARQAGAAAHEARLSVELRRSRERLVNAREEERRRLRRDLHDGLGPTLGGLTLGLDAARSTLPPGASTTEKLLADLKAQTQEAVSDIRRLAHGLRPPALDDLGLVPAIRQQAAKHGYLSSDLPASTEEMHLKKGPTFSVEAPEDLPPLPAAAEVACYRITQEAITNVSRHAKANSCRISLAVDEAWDMLVVEVTDDGVGMPEGRRAGVGMTSMRERAEELGGTLAVEQNPEGGTRVVARLPLPGEEER